MNIKQLKDTMMRCHINNFNKADGTAEVSSDLPCNDYRLQGNV